MMQAFPSDVLGFQVVPKHSRDGFLELHSEGLCCHHWHPILKVLEELVVLLLCPHWNLISQKHPGKSFDENHFRQFQ